MQLILKQIRKSFDSKEVLRDCTYTFEQGRIYGLLGVTERERPLCSRRYTVSTTSFRERHCSR